MITGRFSLPKPSRLHTLVLRRGGWHCTVCREEFIGFTQEAAMMFECRPRVLWQERDVRLVFGVIEAVRMGVDTTNGGDE